MNLLTTAVLLASAFEVLVPVGGHRTAPEKLRCEFESVKKLDSDRIVFVAGVMMRDEKKRAEIVERVRLNVIDAKKDGFRETAAWFWSFWCSDAEGFTTMTGSDGWTSDHICCPLDPGFRQVARSMVQDFARTGVDMVLLDDDYRYGNYHDSELVCTCARHMALVEKTLGEKITPAELKRNAMTGGRNRWRDAWMDANGEAFRDYAAFLRSCVDEVNPKVRLGLCACMSHWDNDGVDAATTARILAGKTRPFLRLISAPYWASPGGPHYYGCNLQSVIEFERMERSWVKGDDIEVVSEGDTYPRPRWTTGSSHLELFDLALRVDGRFSGILKYAVDYDDPTRDGGYVARHVKNRPLYKEVARRFDGKRAVGVRIYEEMNRLREAVLDGDLAGNTKFLGTFGSEAAKCCGDLAIPTVWEGEGLVGMAFGENVRHVPAEARRRGLVIDAWAARILMAQGVDVGVKAWGKKVQTGVDVVADGLVNSYAAYEGYDVELVGGVEIIGKRAAGRPPYAFLYRNAAGEKYLVLPLEVYWTKPGWHRTYEAGRLLADGIRRLAGRALPAFLAGNPDVMLMAKDGSDGSRSVAVFNCFTDALVDAPVELDREFAHVEFVNCRGRLEGCRVILDEVPAYGFAAFTVFPKTVKPLPVRGLCAHRGDRKCFPENSVAAFRSAVEKGAAMVEFDVDRCKTGELVVIHDATVDRTSDGHGKVTELTFEEIRKLDIGIKKGVQFKGTRIPTFDEAIDSFPYDGVWINVHCKGLVTAEVARKLKEKGRLHQAFVAADPQCVAAARAAVPEVMTCLMSGSWTKWTEKDTADYFTEAIGENYEFAQPHVCSFTRELADRYHAHGGKLNYFWLTDPRQLPGIFAMGVNFPLVDELDRMLVAYRQWETDGCPTGAFTVETDWRGDLLSGNDPESLQADENREVVVLSNDGPSTLTFYPALVKGRRTAAVVICPGGGYRELCDTYEGVDMARWLVARGVSAFVLRYRLSPRWHKDAMLADVRLALECVRRRADEWCVDAHKVGILGFSAGGHLACIAGTSFGPCGPDFMGLVYPHVSMTRGLGNEHMRRAFLGPEYGDAEIDRYSGEKLVSSNTPRTFLVHARTDEICSVEHSRKFVTAMRKNGRSVQYLELDSGRHGLGCGKGCVWSAWLNAFDAWLRKEGLIGE